MGRPSGPARFFLALLTGAAASLLAMPLIPSVAHDLGPARVTASAGPGPARTTIVAPPLGTVSAPTHRVPVQLNLSIREIDPSGVQTLVSRDVSLSGLVDAVESDLRSLARRLALQLVLGGTLIGSIAAGLLPGRRAVTFLYGASGGAATVCLALLLTASTYSEERFNEPHFTGALARAPEVIEAFDRGVESFEALGSRYEAVADRLSELLRLSGQPQPALEKPGTSLLHVSDVHSNPLGVQVVNRLASAFEVDAVIDTGDLTSFGEPIEANIRRLVKQVPVPYLFVPGNHDSDENVDALGRLEEVAVLDQESYDVNGIDILGWSDPTFTADDQISTDEANLVKEAEAPRVADALLESSSDVLAVHDVRLAEQSFGDVPLVLAGHTHERSLDEINGTFVLTVGSTGATGLGSFLVEADLPYEAEIVHFTGAEPKFVDYVSFSSFATEFEVERTALLRSEEEAETP
ncbi:MAG: metallophosphoesterase [Actinomycetota bacterium]|nr:metallophosphoesterase [Actinomycetota bacterium]